jgi:putative nucleotidyltransferase with HDIG domain
MALIKVDKLKSGMVLAEDVCDGSQRLLLSKGQELGAQHLRVFKMWGIFQVDVEGGDPEPETVAAASDDAQAAMTREAVLGCFANLDTAHPVVREVVEVCVAFRLKNGRTPEPPGAVKAPDKGAPADKAKILAALERQEIKLPEVPSLVFELNEIMANPLTSSGDIAGVVNKSPSLAALLLKLVNSAFYGFRTKIDNITRAVTLIGSKEVSSLAMGITIMAAFRDIPKTILDVASFMEHSLACGIVSRLLASQAGMAQTEQLFAAGMLHDIGRLILFKYFPQAALHTLVDARSQNHPLLKSELTLTRLTHMQMGKRLLRKWKLPYELEHNVTYHHNPSSSPAPQTAAVVQMADLLVHGLGMSGSGEHIVPAFDPPAWEQVKFPAGAFHALVQQMAAQLGPLRGVFQQETA